MTERSYDVMLVRQRLQQLTTATDNFSTIARKFQFKPDPEQLKPGIVTWINSARNMENHWLITREASEKLTDAWIFKFRDKTIGKGITKASLMEYLTKMFPPKK
jgi:hypothetical protein